MRAQDEILGIDCYLSTRHVRVLVLVLELAHSWNNQTGKFPRKCRMEMLQAEKENMTEPDSDFENIVDQQMTILNFLELE